MEKEDLRALFDLLCEYADDPEWNRGGPAWAAVDQARKQVEIDLNEAGEEDPEP